MTSYWANWFVHPLLSSMFMVPSPHLASFHMQLHLAQDSAALTAEWPNRVPRARPSVHGPQGPTPSPAYLLRFIRAAMAAICETVGKQMPFFHLWNQVFGKRSAFWWPESMKSVSVKGRGQWGGSGLSRMLTLRHLIIAVRICRSHEAVARHRLACSHCVSRMQHKDTRAHDRPVCSGAAPLSVICWCWGTMRGWGCVSERQKPEWNDRLSGRPSPPSLPVPAQQPGRPWHVWHLSVVNSQTGRGGQQHTRLHMLLQNSTGLTVTSRTHGRYSRACARWRCGRDPCKKKKCFSSTLV